MPATACACASALCGVTCSRPVWHGVMGSRRTRNVHAGQVRTPLARVGRREGPGEAAAGPP